MMKKTKLLFLSFLLVMDILFSGLIASPENFLDIDFTRDSTYWKTQFPEASWNSSNTSLTVNVSDYAIGEVKFDGTFGKFDPNSGVMGRPTYIENRSIRRHWAFRVNNVETSYLELPELANVGRFTIFCKNQSTNNESTVYIQKKEGDSWTTIRTIYIPPHHNQDFEMQVEEFININESVKLRIYGAAINLHVYGVRADAFDPALPKEKPLKIILIPDAQTYANQAHLTHVYGIMTQWVNSIADDVKFVIQQGDITQLNNDAHWRIAAGAYNLLEGRKIPFTFCAGNHDMGKHGDSRNTTKMNTYLPYSRYSRYEYFGGTFEPNTVDNTWHTFSKGDYKFLILSLEYLPRNKVLAWASSIIEQHPYHNVIINTHSYLKPDNTLNTGVPQEGLQATGDETPNNGDAIWSKLVKKHKNCLFVFSGHVLGDGAGYRVTTGDNGNKVYQFIANYQGGVDGTQDSRNGMLRILDLEPELKRFSIRTYSPYQDKFNTAVDQQYYYTGVDFIKEGEPEVVVPEPKDVFSEDFSSKSWENELKRLNPGTALNPNAPNANPYSTPAPGGSNAYFNLNSTDLYFDKYKLSGDIEALDIQPCASEEDIVHENENVAVAFRFKNNADGFIEFPEVPSAGTITIHIRNGNANNATWIALEKFENNEWSLLKRFELHPNGALRTSRDEILTFDINSESPVKLRLRNDGVRYMNLYRVSLGKFGASSKLEAPNASSSFRIEGRKIIVNQPSDISMYTISGSLLLKTYVINEINLPEKIKKGFYIVQNGGRHQKVLLN